jgi:hypothetical protein
MPYDFAKLLFGITKLGLTVVITDDPLVPEVVPAPAIFDETGSKDTKRSDAYKWHPEKSLTGPLSIVVSGRDRKIIVLRNGIQIGESDISIDGSISETLAFTLRGQDAAGFHWLRLPLPGQELDAANKMTQEERMRSHIPEQFRAALAAILTPGTTLLVTRETLKSKGTGKHLTVMASDQDTGK